MPSKDKIYKLVLIEEKTGRIKEYICNNKKLNQNIKKINGNQRITVLENKIKLYSGNIKQTIKYLYEKGVINE